MPIHVKQADGSYKVASIKRKTPEEYEMEIYLLEEGRKEYVKDATERMKALQRQIDILYEFVSDNDLHEIQRRFDETEICKNCHGTCDGSECNDDADDWIKCDCGYFHHYKQKCHNKVWPCAICSEIAVTGEDGSALCARCLDDCKARDAKNDEEIWKVETFQAEMKAKKIPEQEWVSGGYWKAYQES
jgi:hypothetical protein